tara:strand:+ start:103 stop:450 length:348 start_codon:yes stop_codon:yes gene_type:complete
MASMKKKMSQRVLFLLATNGETRENDNSLLVEIWKEDLRKTLSDTELRGLMPALSVFFTLFKEGSLSKPESVRRSRQRLQEQDPTLRSDNYNARKIMASNMRDAARRGENVGDLL